MFHRLPAAVRSVVVAITVTSTFAACRSQTQPPVEPDALSLDTLRSMYETSESEYVTIDGVDVHYMDEGSGTPVILLHASFLSLRAWDELVPALAERHRVIRLDTLMSGLTSPAPEGSETVEFNVRLVEGLTDHLGLERVALVGTSSGGIIAFRFAATYPGRVSRLVLINSAGMPRTAQTNPNRQREALAKYTHMIVKPRDYWLMGLGSNFTEPYAAPEWLVDMTYNLHRREGLHLEARRFMAQFDPGDVQQELKDITAPTLIQWGLENRTVMHLEADVFQHWMTGAPSTIRKYSGVGHYPYLENPAIVLDDLLPFLEGSLDSELRKTTMLPP